MFGLGVAKGLGITLKHFINTFIDDLKYFPKSMINEEAFAKRQGPVAAEGLFTVEYPEMKLKTPENFRFIPFLLTDYEVPKDSSDFDREMWLEQNRCTSCGICAKVCPPQCIWIVRTDDPDTGKPIPQPAEFYIDTDICMNCGYCAEYCPFDAIKMDHDFELSDYDREDAHIHDIDRLLKPTSYYASIRPTWNALEEAARIAAEEEKRLKEEAKKQKAAEKAAAQAAKQAEVAKSEPAAKPAKKSPEEIKAQREAMMAKRQAKEAAASVEEGKAESSESSSRSVPLSNVSDTDSPAAALTDTPKAAAAPAKPDNLTKVEGIGPKISGLLKDAGITTFAALAATEVSRIQEILDAAGSRYNMADPTTWPEQAKLAAEGKWDALDTLQNQLDGGRPTS